MRERHRATTGRAAAHRLRWVVVALAVYGVAVALYSVTYLDQHLPLTRLGHRFGAIGQRLRRRPAGLDDDCVHLLLLYFLSFRLTDSVLAAATAGLIYAVTPQLISETRNLNGRAFASLLLTLTMLVLLRGSIPIPICS